LEAQSLVGVAGIGSGNLEDVGAGGGASRAQNVCKLEQEAAYITETKRIEARTYGMGSGNWEMGAGAGLSPTERSGTDTQKST